MKRFYTLLLVLLWLLSGCGSEESTRSAEDKSTLLKEYKAALSSKTQEMNALREKIADLEATLLAEGSTQETPTLVRTFILEPQPFQHEIEVRGSIKSDKNIVLSAETPGRIQNIQVKVGEQVKAQQLLLKLNTDLLQRSLEELENEISLAKVRYERQKNLWNKKIGTEFQYLEAENRWQALKKRRKNILTQIQMAHIRAPFAGTIEETFAKVGELVGPGTGLLRILHPEDMYIHAEVSDAYTGKIQKENPVRIHILSTGAEIAAQVSYVGQVLNNENRTFTVRVDLQRAPFQVYPNQVVILHIADYYHESALIVPSHLIQKSTQGEFLFRIREENKRKIAEKVYVETRLSHKGQTEITKGLQKGDEIIAAGALELTEGASVSIATKDPQS